MWINENCNFENIFTRLDAIFCDSSLVCAFSHAMSCTQLHTMDFPPAAKRSAKWEVFDADNHPGQNSHATFHRSKTEFC